MLWLILIAMVAITWFYLRGEDLSPYDGPVGESFDRGQGRNEEHDAVEASFKVGMGPIQRASRKERLKLMREYMDGISESQQIDAEIRPVVAGGIPAEWVLAPGVNTARRVLYIHGGAFMMGSPRSHRNITARFSAVANAAVLAIDYRLMPENSRKAGIEDCRTAYRWLLQNGPEGLCAADRLFVGGDSAGGNLTLSLIDWLRDQPLRSPDAAVALSPLTDATFSGPNVKRNIETDAMLGPMFSSFMRLPRFVLLWLGLFQNRTGPSEPVISPVFGDLSGLPPTLVQASESEILFDDARRYVNKAQAAGSPVRLQTWNHVPHVWQMFYPDLTEAREAWEQIGAFIAELEPAAEPARAA
ncbi:MAG: alpha/beta hydrolase [Halioglobus sp.]|nr:alpha/beta hydrolase [Halioglobus sp.]